jgi:tetratricopeptide (TPR) repeat protein
MIDRDYLIKLIHAARIASRHDFANSIALDWLSSWPGDLEIQTILAQVEMEQLHPKPAAQRLLKVVTVDPEYLEAYDLLSGSLQNIGDRTRARVFASCAAALRNDEISITEAPSWAIHLKRALSALSSNEIDTALTEIQQALTADPDLPLVTLVAMKVHMAAGDRPAALSIARTGLDRWPECVAFRLILADDLLSSGEVRRGVAYLHQVASEDPRGKVSTRILGSTHPYRSLWPTQMSIDLDRPVPAEVSAVLGDNRLTGQSVKQPSTTKDGPSRQQKRQVVFEIKEKPKTTKTSSRKKKRKSPESEGPPAPEPWESFRGPDAGDEITLETDVDETLLEVEQDFMRLASRINARQRLQDEDGRVPAYIVLSSHTRLIQAYGEDTYKRLDETIMSLIEAVRHRSGWTAYRVYIDDPQTLDPFGLSPADPANAWQIKLRITDLDLALAQRGEMIGALLIIGGESIVPFHTLPNPTDDDDEIVASDNPYATTDENYFAPEWSVGRLPFDRNPDLLIKLLQTYTEEHRLATQTAGPLRRLRIWLARRLGRLFRNRPQSLGYTASIWRKASMAVFKIIGEPSSMLTSPPTQADQLHPVTIRPARLSYFNLHGLEDAPEWFGQRDPLRDELDGPEFPIALRPQDVVNSGSSPKIVFTEACYGANIIGKSYKSALCLKFMDAGTRAIIGSTKISYGSVTTPLIAADLLGRLFWEHLNQSIPVGEALRRAKLKLAAEMHRRQGYIDGEDQKTIISFVLYGDPLYSPTYEIPRPGQKMVIRRTTRPRQMKTVCALGEPKGKLEMLDPDELQRVKAILSQYLPGMIDAQCRIYPQHHGCDGNDHLCPSHQLGIKRLDSGGKDNLVVSFSKHVQDGALQHQNYARLTLDPSGKVLKLAVSR